LEQAGGGHDLIVRRLAAPGDPKTVMQPFRSVAAQADEEVVLLEKGRPLGIEQCAVGLQIVLDPLERLLVRRLQRHHLAEEIQPQQGRLPALPGEDHLVPGLRLDVLTDVLLEHVIGHSRDARLLEQLVFMQVIAIGAVEIARRADRLDHRMEAVRQSGQRERRIPGWGRSFSCRFVLAQRLLSIQLRTGPSCVRGYPRPDGKSIGPKSHVGSSGSPSSAAPGPCGKHPAAALTEDPQGRGTIPGRRAQSFL
jgi:hypothetical protein